MPASCPSPKPHRLLLLPLPPLRQPPPQLPPGFLHSGLVLAPLVGVPGALAGGPLPALPAHDAGMPRRLHVVQMYDMCTCEAGHQSHFLQNYDMPHPWHGMYVTLPASTCVSSGVSSPPGQTQYNVLVQKQYAGADPDSFLRSAPDTLRAAGGAAAV